MINLVIDPGHGGKDPGAVANGLQEKNLTLDIAKRIKRILLNEYEGVKVIMTREDDRYVGLDERVKIANNEIADFFLSIHINAGGGTGFESFRYVAASEKSKEYQNTIHLEIVKAIGGGITDRGKKAKNLHVLRETKMPSMLTENLFIDRADDAAKLKDPAFLEKVARGHVNGLVKAFGFKRKPAKQEQQGVSNGKPVRLMSGTFPSRELAEIAKKRLEESTPYTFYIVDA